MKAVLLHFDCLFSTTTTTTTTTIIIIIIIIIIYARKSAYRLYITDSVDK